MQLDDADLKTIQQRAAEALRRYLSRPNGDTEDLREVALQLVNGRQHFFNREGGVDWRGVSHAYRQWSRETYDLAGVPKDRLSSLQASVRYHVGHVLREVVDADTLADLGLLDQSPRQRSAERHASTYDLAGLFGPGGRITEPEQITAALQGMLTALRRIDFSMAVVIHPDHVSQYANRVAELQVMVDEFAGACRAVGADTRLTSNGQPVTFRDTKGLDFITLRSDGIPADIPSYILMTSNQLADIESRDPAVRDEASSLVADAQALQQRVQRLRSRAAAE